MSSENSCDKKKYTVQTEADFASGTICQNRPDIKPPSIGKPVIKRRSGQKATRLVSKQIQM